jgi:hypothetical protein
MRNDARHSDAINPHFPKSDGPVGDKTGTAPSLLYVDRSDTSAAFDPPRQDDLARLSAMSAKVESVKAARAADLWPAITIGAGIVLTVVWAGSLLWLFVRIILTVL